MEDWLNLGLCSLCATTCSLVRGVGHTEHKYCTGQCYTGSVKSKIRDDRKSGLHCHWPKKPKPRRDISGEGATLGEGKHFWSVTTFCGGKRAHSQTEMRDVTVDHGRTFGPTH